MSTQMSGLFVTPDLVLHVHERWMNGTADEQVVRSFGIRDTRKVPRFVMLGGRAAVRYIYDWSFCDAVRLLRQLPSLALLENEFWEYLSKLKVRGSMRSLPDGSRVEHPTTRGDKFSDGEDEEQFSMPLVELTDAASVVALVSPAITAFIDAQIAYGAILFNHSLTGGPPTFWFAERAGHPLLGRLAAEVETVLGPEAVTQLQERIVYVAWDPQIPRPAVTNDSRNEWRHYYDDGVPLCPDGFSTRVLSRLLDVNVRLLFSGPLALDMPIMGGPDAGT
jgi:hypothetical protein